MTRVVVAGAAGESGRAVIAALALRGYDTVGIGHRADVEVDLGDTAEVEELAAGLGAVDGVIHLAGGWRQGRTDEDWAWLLHRNVTTLRNTTRAFAPALMASPAGRFAMVTSTVVDTPGWGGANYAAAKAAAEAWTRALAGGFRKGGTAAAVIFAVASLGDGGTPFATLGQRAASLWDSPAEQLNGTRIDLTPRLEA